MSTWAIIAIVIAVLAGVVLIGFLLWWLFSPSDSNSNFRLERTIPQEAIWSGDRQRQYFNETARLKGQVEALTIANQTLRSDNQTLNTVNRTLESRLTKNDEDDLAMTTSLGRAAHRIVEDQEDLNRIMDQDSRRNQDVLRTFRERFSTKT